MDSPIDTVAFLAGSENRVAALEALAERPRSRRELMEEYSIARVTLGRVLRELDERNWIVRSGRRYEVTPLGELVISEFADLLGTMETEVRLRDVMPWFPADGLAFDLRCLRDAEVVVPTPDDLTAHVQRAAECYLAAERARVLSYQVGLPVLEAIREAVVENDLRFEAVLTPDLVETLMDDPETASLSLDVLTAPAVDIHLHEEVPSCVFVTDDTVGIALSDDEGILRALVVTEHETVYDWAVTAFDECLQEATPVPSEVLAT